MPDDRPNVLLVHCHDLGRHLGCYGRDVDTPNLDALAGESLRFERYFAAAPQCSPSRGAAMTGRFPHRNGLMGLVHRGWQLNDDETALPEHLREAGYETHLFGLQHEAREASRLGYEHVHADTSNGVDIGEHDETHRALDVAERFAGAVDGLDGPFLATCGFAEPHAPFRRSYVPEEAYERYDPAEVDLPPAIRDDPEVRERFADYGALITATVDPAVGRITEALDDAGLAGETLVVFTTDHGVPFPGAKCTGFDAGLECALLVRGPGIDPGTDDHLLSNVDLLPTLLDRVGTGIPDDLDGRSFRPLLDGGAYEPRERVFAEQTWHVRPSPLRAVRTDRHKYVRNFFTHLPRSGSRPDPDADWPDEELYDLRADPTERTNRAPATSFRKRWATDAPDGGEDGNEDAPDPDCAAVLDELRTVLDEWQVATDDPLVEGCLPLPPRERDRLPTPTPDRDA